MSAPAFTLFLMTKKGLCALEAILAEHGPSAIGKVVVARDRAVERDYHDEIAALARGHGLPLLARSEAPALADDEPAIAIGWRWLIAGGDLIAFHDSLLPRYRGFAPVVSCLINGEPQLGATALRASERYDEGDIVAQAAIDVRYPLRIDAAIDALCAVYARLAVELIARRRRGESLRGTPQDHTRASYSLWRDEADYRIDWSADAARIRRFVDAVGHPYRGAAALLGERLVRVLEAQEQPDARIENRAPGKVIFVDGGRPVVVCGQGLLRIERLVDDQSRQSLLPLERFRSRFG